MKLVRRIVGVCMSAALLCGATGCSLVPSPSLDAEVIEEASRAESAAEAAASALAAVQSATEAANRKLTAEEEELDKDVNRARDKMVRMTPLINDGAKYTIYIPDTWRNMKGEIDPGGKDAQFQIEAGSYDQQVFLLFNNEPMEDSGLTSFDDFFSALTRGVTGSTLLSDIQTSNPESITLETSQLPGKKLTFTALYHPTGAPAQRIAYRIYGAQGDGEYYQFCCWTTAANSAMVEDLLDMIVNSLEIR